MTKLGKMPSFMDRDFLAAGEDLNEIGSMDDEHAI